MLMNQPKISVIIPTRNRAPRLKRCLDSLLQDEYPCKEIIVCDAMSTDGTVELLRSYGEQVRWVSECDGGESDARNKAIRMATGEIIRYLSDDDVPVPGGLIYAAHYFVENSQVDILFGQAVYFYEQVDGSAVPVDTRRRTVESVQLRNYMRTVLPYPASESAFIRRRVFDKIGFFSAMRGFDHEYWARAAKAGLRMDVCGHVFLHYYKSVANEKQFAHAYTELIFSRWILAWRYGTWWDKFYVAIFLIPRLIVLDSLRRYFPDWLILPLRRVRWRWMNR